MRFWGLLMPAGCRARLLGGLYGLRNGSSLTKSHGAEKCLLSKF